MRVALSAGNCPQAYRPTDLQAYIPTGLHIPEDTASNFCHVIKTSSDAFDIGSYHGGHYEECRLLGYKTPGCTSKETHYFFATELSRLMLCKI
jgi:hypothetical protein